VREDTVYWVKEAEELDENCRVVPFSDYFQFQNGNKRKLDFACTDNNEKNDWIKEIQNILCSVFLNNKKV